MLVAYQNDISLIPFRHLEGIGIDNLRALDAKRIMRNAAELEVHQFHREASNRRIKLFKAVAVARHATNKNIINHPPGNLVRFSIFVIY